MAKEDSFEALLRHSGQANMQEVDQNFFVEPKQESKH